MPEEPGGISVPDAVAAVHPQSVFISPICNILRPSLEKNKIALKRVGILDNTMVIMGMLYEEDRCGG